jgi:hypothetical protein
MSTQTSSHESNPVGHAIAQIPAAHASPAAHALPQAPQWNGDVWRLWQPPSQTSWPVGQAVSQLPAEQTSPGRQP